MEQGLWQQLGEAVSEKTVDEAFRREVTRGGNLQDCFARGTLAGVASLLESHSSAPRLSEHVLTVRAQSRIYAVLQSVAEIRNPDTRREHSVGLITRFIADVAFEMLAQQG